MTKLNNATQTVSQINFSLKEFLLQSIIWSIFLFIFAVLFAFNNREISFPYILAIVFALPIFLIFSYFIHFFYIFKKHASLFALSLTFYIWFIVPLGIFGISSFLFTFQRSKLSDYKIVIVFLILFHISGPFGIFVHLGRKKLLRTWNKFTLNSLVLPLISYLIICSSPILIYPLQFILSFQFCIILLSFCVTIGIFLNISSAFISLYGFLIGIHQKKVLLNSLGLLVNFNTIVLFILFSKMLLKI